MTKTIEELWKAVENTAAMETMCGMIDRTVKGSTKMYIDAQIASQVAKDAYEAALKGEK